MNKKTAIITSLAIASFLGVTAVATGSIVSELSSRQTYSQDSLALTSSGMNGLSSQMLDLPNLPKVDNLPINQNFVTSTESRSEEISNISIRAGEQLVLAATGGKLQNSTETLKKGIPTYAITVLRSDKSLVTGYVDKSTGVIFDWEVVQKGTSNSSYSDDDDDNYDDRDDDDDDDDDD